MTGGPAVAWAAEWRSALRRRRLLVLDLLVPLLLVAALLLGGAPSHHAAAVVAVLFVVFAVFGSAIPLVRDGGSGLLLRWLLAGLPPRDLLAGRLLAQAALDLGQLAPAAAVLVVAGHPSGPALETAGSVAAGLAVALLAGNALGAWVAAAARSLAEAALFAAVAALLLLHMGGVFRTPAPGSWQAAVEGVVPFRPLHEALLGALGAPGAGAAEWGPPLLATALFLVGTHLLAPALLGALSRAEEG